MTNKDLINSIAESTKLTKKRTAEMLEALVSILTNESLNGKTVQIHEFGTLELRQKNERVLIHPVTKERTIVPAKQQLSFKQSPLLKDKINKK